MRNRGLVGPLRRCVRAASCGILHSSGCRGVATWNHPVPLPMPCASKPGAGPFPPEAQGSVLRRSWPADRGRARYWSVVVGGYNSGGRRLPSRGGFHADRPRGPHQGSPKVAEEAKRLKGDCWSWVGARGLELAPRPAAEPAPERGGSHGKEKFRKTRLEQRRRAEPQVCSSVAAKPRQGVPSRKNRRKIASARTVAVSGLPRAGLRGGAQRSTTAAIRRNILPSNAVSPSAANRPGRRCRTKRRRARPTR